MYSEFERLRDDAIGEGKIAGAVALTVDRNGVTYESAAGRRSMDGSAAMTPDTVFWIASMTKAIASVAALQLVERGKLALDEELSELLPDLKALAVFDKPGADGVWTTRPAKRAPTLRELLTHTSGFSYGFIDARLPAWQQATGTPDAMSGSRAAHVQPLLSTAPAPACPAVRATPTTPPAGPETTASLPRKASARTSPPDEVMK